MSISSILSNAGSLPQWQSSFQQGRQDFSQLAKALQSGDLAGAQKAYADLQSLQQTSQAGSEPDSNASGTPIQKDFAALGQALASGNLSQAQSDFAQLQRDFQSTFEKQSGSQGVGSAHHGRHHHHHHVESSQNSTNNTAGGAANSSSQTTDNTGSGTGVNLIA